MKIRQNLRQISQAQFKKTTKALEKTKSYKHGKQKRLTCRSESGARKQEEKQNGEGAELSNGSSE